MANSCGRSAKGNAVVRERFAVLCRIVFPRNSRFGFIDFGEGRDDRVVSEWLRKISQADLVKS